MTLSHSSGRVAASQQPAHLVRPQDVTAARAHAQRAKLDAQTQARKITPQSGGKKTHKAARGRNTTSTSIADAVEAYLQDHEGGNHSHKTVEWHATSLGLLRRYLEEEQEITQVEEVDAAAISGWFAYLRAVPGQRGKPRAARTIQTYARSARAFFHWLMRRETLERNPFDPTNRAGWPSARSRATVPCSGCSTIQESASRSCAGCGWAISTANTGC